MVKRISILVVVALTLTATVTTRSQPDEQFDQISHVTPSRNVDVCAIKRPNEKRKMTEYRDITFREGDAVTIRAAGCVPTVRRGKTWKLNLNPQGPNSDHL